MSQVAEPQPSASKDVIVEVSQPAQPPITQPEPEPVPSSTETPLAPQIEPAEQAAQRPSKPSSAEWGLKPIVWPPEDWENQPQRSVKIITQNENGPCSFIAICNILLLRGEIEIRPPDRPSVSYEYLASLLGDYLITKSSDVDLDVVFSILPKTQYGMDLNPLFTNISSFRPAGELSGELRLFDLCGIRLVHGWLVDPDSPEFIALSKTEDYDNSVNAIVDADHLTSGNLVVSEQTNSEPIASGSSSLPPQKNLSEEQHDKISNALLIRQWLDSNPTQLTYYGLFTLTSTLEPNELVAFFRGSHLSVLYKRQDPRSDHSILYSLVTDRVFLRETSVVWESLEDVDGQSSTFVDSHMIKASPAGGDWAGHTGEQIARAYDERENAAAHSADIALARQLQAEEDAAAQRLYHEHMIRKQQQHEAKVRQQEQEARKNAERVKKDKKKGDCIIM